jgi:DNA-3-methyladenine glycosylase II
MTARAQEIRTGLAWLRKADPVLAQLIAERPDFDPDVWIRRLPPMDLFGALIFAIIGQQISVIAARAILTRLTERFGGRVPNASELVTLDPETLRGIGLSRRKAATVLDLAQRFSDGRLSAAELGKLPDQEVIGQLTAVKGIGPGRGGRASRALAPVPEPGLQPAAGRRELDETQDWMNASRSGLRTSACVVSIPCG